MAGYAIQRPMLRHTSTHILMDGADDLDWMTVAAGFRTEKRFLARFILAGFFVTGCGGSSSNSSSRDSGSSATVLQVAVRGAALKRRRTRSSAPQEYRGWRRASIYLREEEQRRTDDSEGEREVIPRPRSILIYVTCITSVSYLSSFTFTFASFKINQTNLIFTLLLKCFTLQ